MGGSRGRLLQTRILKAANPQEKDRLFRLWKESQSRDGRTGYALRRSRQILNFRRFMWSECVALLVDCCGVPTARAEGVVRTLLAFAGRRVSLRTIQRARRLRCDRDAFLSNGPLADTWFLQHAATAVEDSSNPDLAPEDYVWRTAMMAAWDTVRRLDDVELPFPIWRTEDVQMELTRGQVKWFCSLATSSREIVERLDALLASPRRQGRKRVRIK